VGLILMSVTAIIVALTTRVAPQGQTRQYIPSNPPMQISWQGASDPFWFTTTWFCNATYVWHPDYSDVAQYVRAAQVKLAVPLARQPARWDDAVASMVWSGTPTENATFTTPSCPPGAETMNLSIIGRVPSAPGGGSALVKLGPANFVKKNDPAPAVANGPEGTWFCDEGIQEERFTFRGNQLHTDFHYKGYRGGPPESRQSFDQTFYLGDTPSVIPAPPGGRRQVAICANNVPLDQGRCEGLAWVNGELLMYDRNWNACRRER
jgi:hypothetical protein